MYRECYQGMHTTYHQIGYGILTLSSAFDEFFFLILMLKKANILYLADLIQDRVFYARIGCSKSGSSFLYQYLCKKEVLLENPEKSGTIFI